MPPALVCVRCGTAYPIDLDDQWGQTIETSGMGPEPCCVELIEDKRVKPLPNGDVPLQMCRGRLSVSEVADEGEQRELRLIGDPRGASPSRILAKQAEARERRAAALNPPPARRLNGSDS